jgi:hypothetical protein
MFRILFHTFCKERANGSRYRRLGEPTVETEKTARQESFLFAGPTSRPVHALLGAFEVSTNHKLGNHHIASDMQEIL